LAKVERLASSYPTCFQKYKAHHCESVADVPVGQIVLCLPMIRSDVGWRAIVVNIIIDEIEHARTTWMHPACLRPLQTLGARPCARVDLTDKRGSKLPTIDIGPEEVGARIVRGALVLDARWDFPLPRYTRDCTGHCFLLCKSVLTHEICLASILRFAVALHTERLHYCATATGHVCCSHAKHRSVASANILQLCFGVPMDFSLASRERCGQCCRTRAEDHVPLLLLALRTLPALEITPERSLACALRLPE
jgi:hypothetical protein